MSVCTFIASNRSLTEVVPEIQDIRELDGADIWNKPDRQIPSRHVKNLNSFWLMK